MQDLTICISSYNRSEYTIKSLVSLFKVVPANLPIIVFDDCSEIEEFKKLEKFLDGCPAVTLIRMEENQGINKIHEQFYDYVNTKYIYIAENDIRYSTQFLKRLEKLRRYCVNKYDWRWVGTLYNSVCHQRLLDNFGDGYLRKYSTSGQGILMTKRMFGNILFYFQFEGFWKMHIAGWDWCMCQFLRAHDIHLICTEKSYVQHFGVQSTYNDKNVLVEQAINFHE